jgi:hypothetical protein
LGAINVAGATTALTSTGAAAVITTGGVLTGTGMAGFKMAKRTAGVEVFRFIPIYGNKERTNVIISVSGWVVSKQGRGKNMPVTRRLSDKADSSKPSTPVSAMAGSSIAESSSDAESRPRSRSKADSISVTILKPADSATKKSSGEEEQIPEELLAIGLQDIIVPFMGISPVMGAHYALCFDPHILCSLGDALKIFASELISFSAQQILQQTVLATLLSGLNFPLWLLKLGYLVDNPWGMGLDRAKKAGELLADSLCNNVTNGRPVTLIGFSLGARVIYYCLLELAERGKFGLIEDAFLFGAPVLMPRVLDTVTVEPLVAANLRKADDEPIIDPTKLKQESPNAMKSFDEWRKVVSVVSGRFVNAFSRSDWVLGFLFRASFGNLWDVAGLRPVVLDDVESKEIIVLEPEPNETNDSSANDNNKTSKSSLPEMRPQARDPPDLPSGKKHAHVVENIDITQLVSGHIHYRAAMPSLIRRVCGFATWTEDIEIIEDVVGGEWMEEVDGWWKEEAERIARNEKMKKESSKKDQK